MIERKYKSSDLDRHRPKFFLASLAILFAVYFLVSRINYFFDSENLIDEMAENTTLSIDFLPLPEEETNVVVSAEDLRSQGEKLNKVDEITTVTLDEVKDVLEFRQSDDKSAEELEEDEGSAIVPPEAIANVNDIPLRVLEELPEFPGGMQELVKWLDNALKYPESAHRSKQQGMVKVSFVVEKDGSISNVKFLQQTNSILDKEVLRVVKMMPKWKPGTENGKVCRSVVAIPFVFSL